MIVCTRFMLIHPIFETFHPTPQMWTLCWLWRKSKWIPERFIVWESWMSVQNFMAVVVGEWWNDRPANHPLELACLDPQDNILSVEEKQIWLMAQWIEYQRLLLVYMYPRNMCCVKKSFLFIHSQREALSAGSVVVLLALLLRQPDMPGCCTWALQIDEAN